MLPTKALAAFDARSPLRPYAFDRRSPGAHDVHIEVLFCGVCHSDLHQARNEWNTSSYPMVPGHEIAGRVVAVGANVTRFVPGELAGVGCMVDSCRACPSCVRGLEQYCEKHVSWTYNGTEQDQTTITQGGYSSQIVVDERFVLSIRAGQPLERVAPLLCAGITTWSPLAHWRVGKGSKVAIVGLGGLGHMGVKLAASLGAEVTLVSTSLAKKADALRLGAHEFLLSTDASAMARAQGCFDFVLDTVAAQHAIESYLQLVRLDGTLALVGVPEKALEVPAFSVITRRRSLAGSLIGGIAETQRMLDWCADHSIVSDVEVIAPSKIEASYERMLRGDVRYRFVVDTTELRT